MQKIFEDSSEDLGYFIKNIEASIRLCKHMNIEIKPYFVEYYNGIKKMRACSMDDDCNYYPSYYKEMYDINIEENVNHTEFVKNIVYHMIIIQMIIKQFYLNYYK